MSCNDNKISNNCGSIVYSSCVKFEGEPNPQSELTGEECLDQEVVTQDIYNQLEGLQDKIGDIPVIGTIISVNGVDPDNTGNIVLDADDIPQGTTNLYVTSAEKTIWNGKQDALGFTPVPDTRTINGNPLTSDITIDKNSIGLGNVPNINTTIASNITQDANHNFVTDAQINNWNAALEDITVSFSQILGQPTDNSNLSSALNLKANDNNVIHKSGNEVRTGSLTSDSFKIPGGLFTQFLKADGTIDTSIYENTINKQNSLVHDGTSIKYPTVDAVNGWTRNIAKVATKTGLLSKLDTFNLIALDNFTARISAVESCMFWNEIFNLSSSPSSAIKSFPQKDYPLTQLITATGGNVNSNPLTTDGKYIRYLGYDKNGNVYSSINNFASNNDIFQIGFITVLKTGSTVEFLDGTTPGGRNVLAQPDLASNTDFDKVTDTKTNVTISRKSNASFSTSTGTIIGISVNWKSAQNPSNGNPVDVFNYTGQATASFIVIDPTFLTSTSAITTHSLLTELDGGIAVNESFFNTTTGLRGTMANGTSAVARILLGVRGGIFWQMGEFATTACYADLTTAKNNIYSHVFSEAIVPPGVAYEIARVAFTKGATVTNNDTQFYVVNTGGSGSGSSTSIPPVSDATVSTKGILKLAGDFANTSTADIPLIKDASASSRGVVTTVAQTFDGEKTFLARVTAPAYHVPSAPMNTVITANGGLFAIEGADYVLTLSSPSNCTFPINNITTDYTMINKQVTVYAKFNITATTGSTPTTFVMSLPKTAAVASYVVTGSVLDPAAGAAAITNITNVSTSSITAHFVCSTAGTNIVSIIISYKTT